MNTSIFNKKNIILLFVVIIGTILLIIKFIPNEVVVTKKNIYEIIDKQISIKPKTLNNHKSKKKSEIIKIVEKVVIKEPLTEHYNNLNRVDIINGFINKGKIIEFTIGRTTFKYNNYELNEDFLLEIQSYENSFIPLELLPSNETFCFDDELKTTSNGGKVVKIDDHNEKHHYNCVFSNINYQGKETFSWEEFFIIEDEEHFTEYTPFVPLDSLTETLYSCQDSYGHETSQGMIISVYDNNNNKYSYECVYHSSYSKYEYYFEWKEV